jgi:glycerol kinase
MKHYILALDQGTTSSRAIVFAREGRAISMAQQEHPQILPAPGHVEHDPEAIWSTQLDVAREALAKASISPRDIAGIGIANQRETTILWERDSGRPVANAVVWQSRASAAICDRLKAEGHAETFRRKTGLIVDAYFSGTKIRYLLDSIDGLRRRAQAGEVLFGTVDTWLVWKLTSGKVHATDVSNASRTMLWNLHDQAWDDELLRILDIPRAMLPDVMPSSHVFGHADASWLGAPIPIAGIAGDQQAALFGQTCFAPGSVKNTYGTGCFMLLNMGNQPSISRHQLLTTVGWQVDGRTTYCLEGSIFVGGAVVQWLRDGLGLIRTSTDIETLAATVPDAGGVVFVPALVGLGAPYWDPYARGMILGITRGTTAGHIARAALESMAYQSRDLLEAMRSDAGLDVSVLKVDGGASVNSALMQFQADLLGVAVERPVVAETTALGAAYLAGLAVGYWKDQADLAANWVLDRRFAPRIPARERDALYKRWQNAVVRCQGWDVPG